MKNRILVISVFFFIWAGLVSLPLIISEGHEIRKSYAGDNLDKVRDLVNFLQFTLNTIGNPRTTAHEKDIIITQSYLKIFRDSKVQIEDDLDPNRQVVTNKEVQGYLKDVDFFFKEAHFTFDIQNIDSLIGQNDEKVYVVKVNRNLNAITINDDTLNQNIVRYIEINYNSTTDDLKIVSYYSTKLSEEDDLENWWHQLTFEWRLFFVNKYNLPDSVSPDQISKILDIDSIDISENPYITSLEPLSKCEKLTYLNIKSTYVSSLSPLRYLSKLVEVNASGTKVDDLKYLHYSANLRNLNVSGCPINDFSVLSDFAELTSLDVSNTNFHDLSGLNQNKMLRKLVLSGTDITSLDSLKDQNSIRYLDISNTPVETLKPLQNFNALEELIMERTVIDDLSSLAKLNNLKVLNCESSNVSDIFPLKDVQSLKKIYCDNSGVTRDMADKFNKTRPDVLIIFESQMLGKWWSSLGPEWKQVLLKASGLNRVEGKEDLARIVNIDSLSIRNNKTINDLSAIASFRELTYLDCHNTTISDLKPLAGLQDIQRLDISNTNVVNLEDLRNLKKLGYLNIDSTEINDLATLKDLRGVRVLEADRTHVPDNQFQDLVSQNPSSQIIYRTGNLEKWWNNLSEDWKNIFFANSGAGKISKTDKWFLHAVAGEKKLMIDSMNINNLDPLFVMDYLVDLKIENSSLQDINAIIKLSSLKSLTINKVPLSDFDAVGQCSGLSELDLSNTSFEDLSILSGLNTLQKLMIAGTRVKNLKPLEGMIRLSKLDISNTNVKSLKPLFGLPELKILTCFNTSVSSRELDRFKNAQPDCKVIYY